MLVAFNLKWTTSEPPGFCMDQCLKALADSGATVEERTLDTIGFHFVSLEDHESEEGQISLNSVTDGTEIELTIYADPKKPSVISFSSKFEANLAEALQAQTPVPLKQDTGERSIFISYRHSDSADITGRIYDRLVSQYGIHSVFKDVEAIPLGTDFRKVIHEAVGTCKVLLVVVGKEWVASRDEAGDRRLDNPADFVRIELETALERDIPLVPLLVSGATMPKEADLPESLGGFIYRNGIPIRPDPDFHSDMDRLIVSLDKILTA